MSRNRGRSGSRFYAEIECHVSSKSPLHLIGFSPSTPTRTQIGIGVPCSRVTGVEAAENGGERDRRLPCGSKVRI